MACPVRSAFALVAALAVAGLPLLPPEHIHRAGIEGRTTTLVHAHEDVLDGVGAGPAGAGLKASHGDHSLAVFLSTHYNSVSRFAAAPVAVLAGAVVIAPGFRRIAPGARVTAQLTHGPPGATWLTRGPPVLS
jgi:hypothetical protein